MSVRISKSELEGLRIKLLCFIDLILPALGTAVETVRAVILIQSDGLSVKFELTSGYTVGITSD